MIALFPCIMYGIFIFMISHLAWLLLLLFREILVDLYFTIVYFMSTKKIACYQQNKLAFDCRSIRYKRMDLRFLSSMDLSLTILMVDLIFSSLCFMLVILYLSSLCCWLDLSFGYLILNSEPYLDHKLVDDLEKKKLQL